jgi:beta-glucosidase
MSYTHFTYSNLRVDKTHFTADDVLTVQLEVTNSGNVAGKESVLLYSSDLVASMVPDNKRLRAFHKLQFQPGETETVVFKLPAKDLAFVGTDGRWILEEGDFQLKVGKEILTVHCDKTKVWDTPNM